MQAGSRSRLRGRVEALQTDASRSSGRLTQPLLAGPCSRAGRSPSRRCGTRLRRGVEADHGERRGGRSAGAARLLGTAARPVADCAGSGCSSASASRRPTSAADEAVIVEPDAGIRAEAGHLVAVVGRGGADRRRAVALAPVRGEPVAPDARAPGAGVARAQPSAPRVHGGRRDRRARAGRDRGDVLLRRGGRAGAGGGARRAGEEGERGEEREHDRQRTLWNGLRPVAARRRRPVERVRSASRGRDVCRCRPWRSAVASVRPRLGASAAPSCLCDARTVLRRARHTRRPAVIMAPFPPPRDACVPIEHASRIDPHAAAADPDAAGALPPRFNAAPRRRSSRSVTRTTRRP